MGSSDEEVAVEDSPGVAAVVAEEAVAAVDEETAA